MPLSSISRWLSRRFSSEGSNQISSADSESTPQVVLTLPDGRKLTMDQLQGIGGSIFAREGKLLGVTGKVCYENIGAANVSCEAQNLHQQARQAGAHCDYEVAIELLERASQLAPAWPYPIYDRAFTHLLMQDFPTAQVYYQKTVQLAPRGFFTAITAVHTLQREQSNQLPLGTYRAYLSLEWMNDKREHERAVRDMVQQLPQFAPAWKELASLCDDDTERMKAIDAGLAASPDAETCGLLLINKALALNLKGSHDAALQMLAELALDPRSTLAAEQSAKAAIAILAMHSN